MDRQRVYDAVRGWIKDSAPDHMRMIFTPDMAESLAGAIYRANGHANGATLRKRGTRLDPDWQPDQDGKRFAVKALGTHERSLHEYNKFRDHWLAKAGQGAIKVDWDATWRNWVRRAAE